MITLPTLPTSVSSESLDLSAGGDNLAAASELPQGFLTLLGNRLLTLAQQSGEAGTAPSGDNSVLSASVDKKQTPTTELSALLAALDKPEALNALLQTESVKGETKSADDKDKLKTTELSDTDKQALQALYAMLPQAPVQPVAAALKTSASTEADIGPSDKKSALNAALTTLTAKTAAEGDNGSNSTLLPVAANSNAPASTRSEPASVLSASSSFQQALNSFSKDDSKDASATPASTTTLSTAVVSAASAPVVHTASATTMTPATPQLNSQLGSPEWQQALSQQVLMFSRNGQQNAELRLHPQDLGSIQISLKLDNDQAQLSMVSGHSQVRAALEAAIPQLRHALAESGINLGQSNVSSDAFPQSQTFSGQQESRRESGGSFAQAMESDNEITPIAVPAALQAHAAGNSAVDIFA